MKRNRRPHTGRRPAPASASIESAWRSYDKMVLPPDAPEIQRKETRLAFYGGAATLFYAITQFVSEGDEPTAADMAMMEALHRELDEFNGTFDAEVEKRRPGSVAAAKAERPSRHTLGDPPIEPSYREKMKLLAGYLDEYFNGEARGPDRKTGVVLLVFPFGDTEGRCNFISNGADRRNIVTLFREMIARFEGQPEITGHA